MHSGVGLYCLEKGQSFYLIVPFSNRSLSTYLWQFIFFPFHTEVTMVQEWPWPWIWGINPCYFCVLSICSFRSRIYPAISLRIWPASTDTLCSDPSCWAQGYINCGPATSLHCRPSSCQRPSPHVSHRLCPLSLSSGNCFLPLPLRSKVASISPLTLLFLVSRCLWFPRHLRRQYLY